MTIEVLYFDGCPRHDALAAHLHALLDAAGVRADVALRRIESDDDAQRTRFLGSPSVRVDGRDVEPGAEAREDFGLKCRLYQTPDGLTGPRPTTGCSPRSAPIRRPMPDAPRSPR
jgi:hypothetical protein